MGKYFFIPFLLVMVMAACTKPNNNSNNATGPRLRFVLKLDSTQARLDAIGNPSTIPSNHRAQSPRFNSFGAHYIELSANDLTGVGAGTVLYVTHTVPTVPVTVGTSTFTNAIDFDSLNLKNSGEEIFSIPLSQVKAGSYKWFRMSVAYQNYDVNYVIKAGTTVNTYTFPSDYFGAGTLASFVGFQTYINSYMLKTQSVPVYAPKMQGYWGFESPFVYGGASYTTTPTQGQAPAGVTTVVNPIFATSPIPQGSCLVTGQFKNKSLTAQNLTITGTETADITVVVSMSTNNSFEWLEMSGDNYYCPLNGDVVTDMGLRGLIPIIQ